MLPNPKAPIRSFLTGCLFLAALVTGALMVWTLRQDGGQKYCVAGGGELFGLCRPTADFLLNGLVWYALIFGALALPIVSVMAMRWAARRRGSGN
ncbi:MAG: hypothetical protein CMM77_15725 [Rhodospirillaceae bacterium]|nr:hypothetical protein [Magnetovibrio sp.]MAY68563.1 hypothetical protein [Rhodospirillaceae bacterium]|tara:strand:- start:254 stop:538 length:285 start_codon:yes stop_codon:yes gene_type:complete